uniref:Thymidylate kinase n=1 Tax=Serratia phage Kevin TaxID=3161161 RepID=A0AAU8KYA4_9CAUD
MSKMIVIKGTSGTGKGTRVVQLIEFLRTKYEPVVREYGVGNKTRPFGLVFEELKLMFVGQYTRSNKSGLTSWTSMDAIHAAVGKGEIAREFLSQYLADGYTLVCEGEPLMLSDKWRPEWMVKHYGLEKLSMLYFHYEDRDQYDARIIGRSGKKAGDGGWARNVSYPKEFEASRNEMNALLDVEEVHRSDTNSIYSNTSRGEVCGEIALVPHDAPLRIVGFMILGAIGKKMEFQDEFSDFCDQHPMCRGVDGTDPLAHRVEAKKPRPETVRRTPEQKQQLSKSSNLLDMLLRNKK